LTSSANSTILGHLRNVSSVHARGGGV
jgi:hypothetical protein